MADSKSTLCLSSDLHLSIIKIRPERGQLLFSKICVMSYKLNQLHLLYAPNVANLGFLRKVLLVAAIMMSHKCKNDNTQMEDKIYPIPSLPF